MTATETLVDPAKPALVWKRYVGVLLASFVIVWAAFNPLSRFVSPGWVGLLASIPAVWALRGLIMVVGHRLLPPAMKPFVGALLGCLLTTVLTIMPGGGFMLWLVAIPVAIWALANLAIVRARRESIRRCGIILCLWLITFLVILGVHAYWAMDARRAGDAYVHAVERYRSVHGSYPADIQAAGLMPERKRYMLGYSLYRGKPVLLYAGTFTIFTSYDYDFDHRVWVFRAD